MTPQDALLLAQTILAVHIAIAAFVVFGIFAIPLGARLGWPFVYFFWWRVLHAGTMGLIALQKLMGNSCFLSIWEQRLVDVASRIPHPTPIFQTVGEHVLYWNLPLWFFAALYSLLFVVVGLMWFFVPPGSKSRPKGRLLHGT